VADYRVEVRKSFLRSSLQWRREKMKPLDDSNFGAASSRFSPNENGSGTNLKINMSQEKPP